MPDSTPSSDLVHHDEQHGTDHCREQSNDGEADAQSARASTDLVLREASGKFVLFHQTAYPFFLRKIRTAVTTGSVAMSNAWAKSSIA